MQNKEDFIQNLNIETDEDIGNLIDNFESQITSYIGIPVKPIKARFVEKNFNDDVITLTFYPIASEEDIKITIDDKPIVYDFIEDEAGLIYLKEKHKGFLKIEYSYGLTNELYEMYIKSLVTDMINYHFQQGWLKNASSIKEGDVQVNYDTSLGQGAIIQSKLDNLRNWFGVRCELI